MNGDHRYGYISSENEKEAIRIAHEKEENFRKQVIEIIKEELPKIFAEFLKDGKIIVTWANIVGRPY